MSKTKEAPTMTYKCRFVEKEAKGTARHFLKQLEYFDYKDKDRYNQLLSDLCEIFDESEHFHKLVCEFQNKSNG